MPSLKNRIAFVYLATTGILVSLVYVIIYVSASKILYSHYDEDLKAEFGEVGGSMSIQDGRVFVLAEPDWTEREHGEATVAPVLLQANDAHGAVLRTSPNLRDTRLQFYAGRADTFVVSQHLGTTWIRQIQGPIVDRDGVLEGYLLVGMGIAEAKHLLDDLMWIMLLSFPVMVGVILVISRVFGAGIVRPIASLMSTADRISRENLEERVPIPSTPDELRQLSSTVNNLLDRLQELIVREQTFAADAAHELRTPLAVIKGTLEVLIRQPREPKHYEEKLRYCIAEIDRMNGLVDQLLLISKYESGGEPLRLADVDVAQSMAKTLERLDPFARSKRISFQLEFIDSTVVSSDPPLLTAIFENLISNAIKYSSEESVIAVAMKETGEGIDISIADHGSGMTSEQIDKVFNRFYRVETSGDRQAKGFGLGLALVRRLSNLLQIQVSLQSVPGQGTTFLLRIPRQPERK